MSRLNLPNAISLGRIVLVPVVVLVMLDARDGGSPVLAAASVVVLAASDALDGYLARRRGAVTDFGKKLDPIADKLLLTGALAVLVVQDRLWLAVAVAIVARELSVTGLRSYASRRGVVISASRLGKNKATLQIVAIVVLILAPDPGAVWVLVVVFAALALTLVSGAEYFVSFARRAAPGAGPVGQSDESAARTAVSRASRSKSSSREAPRR